ncbi:hypothetical protein ACQKII_09495 [Lysinibacillus sp. NPDC048646]|uniref:hypothetical protein n=1 Tax=Lysinibacillus sp. NPDC048646 TaxID=3390574 RepID=UPI003D07550D
MDKEQVIEKLGEVFEEVCKQFIEPNGYVGNVTLTEIRELGQTLINARTSIQYEVMKASEYIDDKIETAIGKNFDAKKIAQEFQRLQSECQGKRGMGKWKR